MRDKITVALLLTTLTFTLFAQEKTETWRGRFTPEADYVLSGQLSRDLPPLPAVPISFQTEGFRTDRLSKVPPVGVHPRVVLSPDDIDDIRAKVKLGEEAGRNFNIVYRELQNRASQPIVVPKSYNTQPWNDYMLTIPSKALLALITEDKKLGREAVADLIAQTKYMERDVDIINTSSQTKAWKDNFFYFSRTPIKHNADGSFELKTVLAGGDSDQQSNMVSIGMAYDYVYNFMTAKEREYVRSVISKMTFGKYTTGMEMPGHMYINNHMTFGSHFISLALSIEGEKGYDPRILKVFTPRMYEKISYVLSPGGYIYERIKGYIPRSPMLAVARRGDRDLLRHTNLRAWMYAQFIDADYMYGRYIKRNILREGYNVPAIGNGLNDERHWAMLTMGGPNTESSWSVNWLMKHFYPEDPVVDFVFKANNNMGNFDLYKGVDGENYDRKIQGLADIDILLMTATDGFKDATGAVIDYDKTGVTPGLQSEALMLKDSVRGVAQARSSWDIDALNVHYECRPENYYTGHESSEPGDFQMTSHGVRWIPYAGAYFDPYFRNVVLVDGEGPAGMLDNREGPVSGEFLDMIDTPESATFISDATNAYNWKSRDKLFELDHAQLRDAWVHMAWNAENPFIMNRKMEIPFLPRMKTYHEGFGNLDWGAWHGENRGIERYQQANTIDHVFRTFHMARGKYPYVIVVDDVQKDDSKHQYDWNLNLAGDAVLWKMNGTPLSKNPNGFVGTDLFLCLEDAAKERTIQGNLNGYLNVVTPQPKVGDPVLLVRVLWRNNPRLYPMPTFEKANNMCRVTIPAIATNPDFKVMLFPHRVGDPLPATYWTDDMRVLTVEFEGVKDQYMFDSGDRGQSAITMSRNGKQVMSTKVRPAKPQIINGQTMFTDKLTVAMKTPAPGSEIRYTTDGTEPTKDSKLYIAPFEIDVTTPLKAITSTRFWVNGDALSTSETVNVEFKKESVLPAQNVISQERGLLLNVYEIKTSIFDERGFFTGKKRMLPDLSKHKPIWQGSVSHFEIPQVKPIAETRLQKEGFFEFLGAVFVPADGVYKFKINSCGPITFAIDGKMLIDVTGQYGLSQKDRYAEVALAKGYHRVQLVITDPVFWKGEMEDKYVIDVAVKSSDSQQYKTISTDMLRRTDNVVLPFVQKPVYKKYPALSGVKLESGLVERRYDMRGISDIRYGVRPIPGAQRDEVLLPEGLNAYAMAIDNVKPYITLSAEAVEGHDIYTVIKEFSGYFNATASGLYEFELDKTGCNQLLIDGVTVAQNKVNSPSRVEKIYLESGLHKLSFRMGKSKSTLKVKTPMDNELRSISVNEMGRDTGVEFDVKNPTDWLAMRLESDLKNSAQPQSIVETTGVVAVKDPIRGDVVKLSGKGAAIQIKNLKMVDDESTFSAWIKLDNTKNMLYLLSRYATFNASISNGAIRTNYDRSKQILNADASAALDGGKWVHVAITYSNAIKIYVNGELVEAQNIDRTVIRGANSRYPDMTMFNDSDLRSEPNVIVDDVRIYNMELNSKQIKEIFNAK